MKKLLLILFALSSYSTISACSFDIIPFCNTIHDANPDNVVLRGYFSEEFENGLIFTRLETLRGDEDRSEIKIWDNMPFDCNGITTRLASDMGSLDQEVIISVSKLDSLIFGDEDLIEDYRVPVGLRWESHNLYIEDGFVHGYYSYSQGWWSNGITMPYEEFKEDIIDNEECIVTNTEDEEINQNDINIYPTITNDYLNIDYKDALSSSSITVYNFNGQVAIHSLLSGTLDLSALENGMYIAVIRTRENKTFSQKVIKI